MLEYGLFGQKQQEIDNITSSLHSIWNDKQYQYFCNNLIVPIKDCLQQHENLISNRISCLQQVTAEIELLASKY